MNFSFKLGNTSALTFFQVFRYATLVLTGVLFAKSNLSTTQIGQYETLLFIASALSFFWLNGLIQGFLVIGNKNKEHSTDEVLYNSFILLFLLSLLGAALIFLLRHSFSQWLSVDDSNFFSFLALYFLLMNPSYLLEYFFLTRNKPKTLMVVGSATFTVQLLLTCLPVFFFAELKYALVGLVISAAIRFLVLVFILIRYSKPTINTTFQKKYILLSYPLIVAALLSGSGDYIDGFIINHFFDSSSFAIYRYGAREFPLILLVATALSNTMLLQLSEPDKFKTALLELRNKTQKLVQLFFPLSMLLIAISHLVFPIVFNINFAESATIFNIYLLLISGRLLFPHTILTALGETRIVMISSLFEILVNIFSSILLMKFWGLAGIAVGTVISSVFQKLFLIIYLKTKMKLKLSDYFKWKSYLSYLFLLILVFVIVEFFYPYLF